MAITRHREGRLGVLGAIVLLTSIVLFIGCLFLLTVNGPWGGGTMFGDDLFKPASMQTKEETEQQIPVKNETKPNMTEALEDLSRLGCVITEYTESYPEEDVIKLEYTDFKIKAVKYKIVFTTETQGRKVLFVKGHGEIYGWSP